MLGGNMATRKRRSGRIFFLLALVIIVVIAAAAILMRDQIMALISPPQEEQSAQPVVPTPMMQDIVVVIQPVKRGTALTEAMLGTVAYPQEDMVEGLFYTDLQDVVGKRAQFDLQPGTPVTPSLLSAGTQGSFISFDIPPGMVAISVPIPIKLDEVSDKNTPDARYAVSYALQPGDHVDVISSLRIVDLDQDFQTALPNNIAAIFKNTIFDTPDGGKNSLPVDYTLRVDGSEVLGRIYQDPSVPDEFFYIVPSEDQRPRYVSQSIVQNAIVLWVGEFPLEGEATATPVPQATPETEDQTQQTEATPEPIKAPQYVTVAVSQQDAIALNFLILTEADINFVLRSAGDDQVSQPEAVTLQFIMDQYNIPYPSKLPYGLGTRKTAPQSIEQPVAQ
jgi:Flp pilus assembly protein CpaB